jgi:methyl-accepting chemotaxis protein
MVQDQYAGGFRTQGAASSSPFSSEQQGRVAGMDPSKRELVECLLNISGGLEGLIHKREVDFLRLGEMVMGFSEQSRRLSDKAMNLSGMVSNQSMDGSVRMLSEQVEEILAVCNIGTSSQCLEDIDRLRKGVQGLTEKFVDFRKIVRNLQMLGIATRIESARLGDLGKGFANLSEEVDKLAQTIIHDLAIIQERTKRLESVVHEVRAKAGSILGEQLRCGEGIRVDIEKNIQALSRITRNADLFTGRLSEKTQQISTNLSKIVSSLQFHDIVRQQVEHITHSLAEMTDELRGFDQPAENGTEQAEEFDEQVLLGWVRDVGHLNSAQLRNAGNRFEEAVEHIRESLREIGSTTLETADEVDLLVRGGSEKEGDLLENLRRNTEVVVAMLDGFGESMRTIAGLMDDLGVTVSDMECFLESIEGVGEEIELIALNATINSAHTGEKGRPLSVLAEAIRGLSIQARKDTALFTDNLREITASSNILKGRAAELVADVATDRLTEGQRTLLTRIEGMSRSFNSLLQEVREDGMVLGRSLHGRAHSIDIHREICPRLMWAAGELEKMAGSIAEEAACNGKRPDRLELLLSRYTMEMERIVYQSTFGLEQDEAAPGKDEGNGQENSEHGWDNVELF